jgi:hypothetical protein
VRERGGLSARGPRLRMKELLDSFEYEGDWRRTRFWRLPGGDRCGRANWRSLLQGLFQFTSADGLMGSPRPTCTQRLHRQVLSRFADGRILGAVDPRFSCGSRRLDLNDAQ